MALASIDQALQQLAANLNWEGSPPTARLALEAVRYLLVHRANAQTLPGATFSFESLQDMERRLSELAEATGGGNAARRSFTRGRAVQW